MKEVLLPVRLVGAPRVIAEAATDLHLISSEFRLHPERAPGTTLARKTVADRDGERIAGDAQTELPAVTCGLSRSHRHRA
jgi:hypothetical protein